MKKNIKVLIIGNGAREHALTWKMAQSKNVERIWVAKGNPGTKAEPKTENIDLEPTDIQGLLNFAQTKNIDLTIVGPETPLALGIADVFQQHHLKCFGPTQKGAQLESSKIFAKQFMQKYNIPTARFAHFNETKSAIAYLHQQKFPVVIKADGLASGKGVFIVNNFEEGQKIIQTLLEENRFGSAGQNIVIEEFIHGLELSYIAMVDGEQLLPLASSEDHKRRDDGDQGPNTGGMGAYSPSSLLTEELEHKIIHQIFHPVLKGLKNEGIHYTGFLYAGLMIDNNLEPKVLEFNCRLGDPEAQVILMRMQSDLADLCMGALEGHLNQMHISWDPRPALTVVMAARGYPENPVLQDPISGIEHVQSAKVFHAGTGLLHDQLVTAGGRVLCITTLEQNLKAAQKTAYQEIEKIHWQGCFYRKDIGQKGNSSGE